jgi:multimeric flavodoxin WrbA
VMENAGRKPDGGFRGSPQMRLADGKRGIRFARGCSRVWLLVKREARMAEILAVYGSPRRRGNTATLMQQAVRGARDAGSAVEEIVLRDMNISPCLELYACRETGRCGIDDDFGPIHEKLLACRGLMLASPIFFYAVSAHTKIFIDRCQALWAQKYLIEKAPFGLREPRRKGLFLSAGATGGPKLFDGALMTVRYFFDVLDMELYRALLYRRLDGEEDALKFPETLDEAYRAGREFALAVGRG